MSCLIILAILSVFYWTFVRFKYGNKKNVLSVYGIFYIISIVGFLVLFNECIFDGMKLSYNNINYSMHPFSSLGVKIDGPLLSDVADSILPELWNIFKGSGFLTWNRNNTFGFSNYSNIYLILYPINYLYMLGLDWGQLITYILQYIIGFLGMAYFMRSCCLSKISSYIAGITYTFCSVIVMWGGWFHSDVMAFGPWLFFFVESAIKEYSQNNKIKVSYGIGFIIVLYLMLVAGMPTYVPFFIYSGFAYTLFRLFSIYNLKNDWKKILYFIIAVAICIIIAGLMSFAYTGQMYFGTSEYREERSAQAFASLGIEYLRTMFLPYYREGFSIHANECTIYIGPLTGFLIPALIIFKRKTSQEFRCLIFWICVFLLSLLFVFSRNSGYIYQFILLLNSSNKFRVIALVCFSGSIITSYVCEFILKGQIYCDNKIKMLIGIFSVPVVIWLLYGGFEQNKLQFLSIIIIAILLAGIMIYKTKWFSYALCMMVTLNMTAFGYGYMPMIDKNAPSIPEATDSVKYIKENTSDNTRAVFIGNWNLFPNSNVYYGINQVATHSMANTNSDIKNYLSGISDDAYKSPTRTEFNSIENRNLLSYGSVKYIVSAKDFDILSDIDSLIKENNTKIDALAYNGESILKQSFISSEDIIYRIDILLSTYAKTLSKNDFVNIYLTDENGRTISSVENICLFDIKDNAMHSVVFDEPVKCGAGKKVTLVIEPEGVFENPLALWITERSIYDGELTIGEQKYNGDISMEPIYGEIFSDGEYVVELENVSPRVFFAKNIKVLGTEEEVLESMKNQYLPDTAFVTSEESKGIQPQEGGLSESIVNNYEINNNTVTVDLKAGESGMLVLNDYYDDDWKVFVNGNEQEIIKTNYLFRGVYIPEAGDYTIEFVYKSSNIYLFVTCAGFLALFGIIIFRKKIEIAINYKNKV